MERYDPAADVWEELATMPTARLSFAAAVVDGRIYAMGGFDGHRCDFSELESLEVTESDRRLSAVILARKH